MTTNEHDIVDSIYRAESRRVLATLIRLLGDFDLAEEALHDAFMAAVEQWSRDGLPDNPRAWLVSAGRFKAIDRLRKRARFDHSLTHLLNQLEDSADDPAVQADTLLEDDRLRLIFTCCHPALPDDAQVALTLREVCGLTTEEIAHAFLVPATTLAQRIVRAKAKIKAAAIPYEVPAYEQLSMRLDAVLRVIYLVFNEGYSASFGESVTRADLSAEAIRLCRLVYELLPEPEVAGLLALMLLNESRHEARMTSDGELVTLEEQDRDLWDHASIHAGVKLLETALASKRIGPYTLQAAIAAVHAQARRYADTDWREIVGLYDLLLRLQPSPVIELNRAVAIAMRDDPAQGLALIDAIHARGELTDYHLLHAARADLYRRLGRQQDAISAYERALELATLVPEQQFIRRRMRELSGKSSGFEPVTGFEHPPDSDYA